MISFKLSAMIQLKQKEIYRIQPDFTPTKAEKARCTVGAAGTFGVRIADEEDLKTIHDTK